MAPHTERTHLIDAVQSLAWGPYQRCSVLFGPGACAEDVAGCVEVTLETRDAKPSKHGQLAFEADKNRVLRAARAWAPRCPLLWQAPIGDVGMCQRPTPNRLAFAIKDGSITHFDLCLHVYTPLQKRWAEHTVYTHLEPGQAPKLLAILEHFQGPFASWGHVSHAYGTVPLMARDAHDAHLLERLIYSPRGLFEPTTQPLPKSILMAYHTPLPIDLAAIHGA